MVLVAGSRTAEWEAGQRCGPRGTSERVLVLGGLLLLAVTAAVYAPIVTADFVWDDQGQILDNADNLALTRIPSYFLSDIWAMTHEENIRRPPYYRPLFLASLAVDHALFGLSAHGYHLTSLLWHLAAVLALLAFLRQWLSPVPALIGATVFALHPVQSESVCWISGRADPMAAAFGFLALWALGPERSSSRRRVGGTLALMAALFSKEPAVFFPVLLVSLDVVRRGRPGPVRRYLGTGIVLAVWAVLRTASVSGTALPPGRLDALWPRVFDVAGLYGRLLVWPHPLTTGRHLLYLSSSGWSTGVGIGAAVAIGLFLAWRGRRLALAGLSFSLLTFLPSMYAMAGSYQLGERYLYLPMGGLALAIGAAVRRSSLPGLVWILPVPLLGLWTIQDRLPDWTNGLTLTASEVRVAPNPYSWGGYGLELAAVGRWREALPWLEKALAANPPAQSVCTEVIRAALTVGEAPLAARLAEQTRRRGCHPTYELVLLHAVAYARTGRWDDLDKAVRFLKQRPEDPRWLPLAGVLTMVRRGPTAYQHLVAGASAAAADVAAQVRGMLQEAGRPDLAFAVPVEGGRSGEGIPGHAPDTKE